MTHRYRVIIKVTAALIAMVSCYSQWSYIPPDPAPERPVQIVDAPFDSTWNAVIDVFATRNYPIATIEKVSGLIVAAPLTVNPTEGEAWADCGRSTDSHVEDILQPTRADMNIIVRDAGGGRSTVRMSIRWIHSETTQYGTTTRECQTKNVYETDWETAIKQAAERPGSNHVTLSSLLGSAPIDGSSGSPR